MSRESNTIIANIYKIDKESFQLMNPEVEGEDIPTKIIAIHNEKANEGERFKSVDIVDGVSDKYDVELYFGEKWRKAAWCKFFKDVVSPDDEVLEAKNKYVSFVLFATSKTSGVIFAMAGGQGNFLIQDYIDEVFGLNCLTRIIGKDEQSIKLLRDRGLTGSILSNQRIFRVGSSFANEDSFAKLAKEVLVSLKSTHLAKLGLDSKKAKNCLAKSSFKIGTSIDMVTFLKILGEIEKLLKKKPFFDINNIRELSKKRDKDLILQLEETMLDQLKTAVQEDDFSEFDFNHEDIESFIKADKYKVVIGMKQESFDFFDPSRIFETLKESLLTDDASFTVENLKKVQIYAEDNDGNTLTRGNLLEHMHTEISLNGKSYFKIDKKWFELLDSFLDSLKSDVETVVKEHYDDLTEYLPFEEQTEDDYITEYINEKPNIYVLHKVFVDKIELCDLMMLDGDMTNLIHIKKGFNVSMRDLCSQVLISARYIWQKGSSRGEIISEINKKLKNHQSSDSKYYQKISQQEIPSEALQKSKNNIKFTVAIAHDESLNIKDDVGSAKSNIAKHELVYLARELRLMGFRLSIVQLSASN